MEFRGINAVSKTTGIHPSSLRRWEDMGLISPQRIDMGSISQRVFTPEDIDLLTHVKNLINSGVNLRMAFAWAMEIMTLNQRRKNNVRNQIYKEGSGTEERLDEVRIGPNS